MIIVSYVASGDRFISFKAGGDRRDGSLFFYRAGYRMDGREESCLIFANCFLPCMWPEVIDLFPSEQAGIAGMAGSRLSVFIGHANQGQDFPYL